MVCLGFPEGGATSCATKGVVSRVDAQLYAHTLEKGFSSQTRGSPGKLLILQVDAAINPGSSGGPALAEDGSVLGVASSALDGAQNVSYIIPALLVQLFVDEFQATQRWQGVCEMGFTFRNLECSALRESYGAEAGVLVNSVAPLGPAHGLLQEGDVLLTIDELPVRTDGRVPVDVGVTLPLAIEHVFSSSKKARNINALVLRQGKRQQLRLLTGTCPPLLPRFALLDAFPAFAIFGGLVFGRLSMPLVAEMLAGEEGLTLKTSCGLLTFLQRWKVSKDEEVLILQRVLRHTVNDGIDIEGLRVVQGVNDQQPRCLADLIRCVLTAPGPLRFELQDAATGSVEHEMLPKGALLADDEILAQNGISTPVSPEFFDLFAELQPDSRYVPRMRPHLKRRRH